MGSYIAAFIGSLAFAGVILTDKIMSTSTYSRPMQPLAVSSVLGFAWSWLIYLFFDYHQPPTEAMWMALAAGFILSIANGVYFLAIFSPHGEATEVSAWDSTSAAALILMTPFLPVESAISKLQIIGIFLAPAGLFLLRVWGDQITAVSWTFRCVLVLIPIFGALHIWVANQAEAIAAVRFSDLHASFAAISPFYWAGGLVGILPLAILRKEREAFRTQLPILKSHWRRLFIVELLAMIGFAAQLYGFTGGHPAVINTLVGSFPLLIFLGGILLRREFGYSSEIFPIVKYPFKKFLTVCFLIIAIALVIS